MNNFRLLAADEIECRISQISKKGTGLSLLLYKTARTDANLLDAEVGAENWMNDFKLIDGVLYGGIGIRYGTEWIWKWDAGVESNTEAEKGRASDAFKRAGFKHGIGRELYTAPFIFIPKEKCNLEKPNDKYVCYDSFAVSQIDYDENEAISALVIVNAKTGEIVFNWKAGQAQPAPAKPAAPKPAPKPDPIFNPTCADCGVGIDDRVHDYSVRRFGRPLCRDCQKKT